MAGPDASSESAGPRALEVLLVVAALGAFAWYVRGFWPQMLDDAFISFRYSENLAAGRGPVWNRAGPPAEGYTGVLWVLVMAVPHALSLDVPATARTLGIAATLASFAVAGRFAYRLCDGTQPYVRWLAAAVASFIPAVFYPIAAQAVSGMETALFSLLFVLFLYLATFVPERPTRGGMAALASVALLLGLTRPEGVMMAAIGLAAALARIDRDQRIRLVRFSILFLVIPGAAYFIWRTQYYGHLFPIPFYVKVTNPSSDGVTLLGAERVASFLMSYGLPLAPLLAVAAWRSPARTAPTLIATAALLSFYLFPRHLMGLQWRFLVPSVPALAALAGSGVAPLVARWPTARWVRASRMGVAIGLCPILALILLGRARSEMAFAESYGAILEGVHMPLARELRKLRGDGPSPVLAIADAGVVPYYSGWETIDLGGLNERSTAAGSPPDAEAVVGRRPDLVVITSLHKRLLFAAPGMEGLLKTLNRDGMTKIRTIGGPYYQWLIARPESEVARVLTAWKLEWVDPTNQLQARRLEARLQQPMRPEVRHRLLEERAARIRAAIEARRGLEAR